MCAYQLWKQRNDFIFDNLQPSRKALVRRTYALVTEILNAGYKFQNHSSEESTASSYIQWFPPLEGWVKVNYGGAFDSNSGEASCACVLYNHKGSFLASFACKLGGCSIVQSELSRILHGLRLTRSRGFRCIHIESDSLTAIYLLERGCVSHHPCHQLVQAITHLGRYVPHPRWSHIFREANALAKFERPWS